MTEATGRKISFRRSGGLFAGNQLETTVSESELAPGLLERADVASHARRSPIPGPGADTYQYELEVEGGGDRHQVVVQQTAVPDDLRPLIEWLERRAEQERDRAR